MPKNKEQRRAAARVLDDELISMQLRLERAEIILQEVAESYFEAFDPKTEEGRFGIAFSYARYKIYAEIVSDYLYEIRLILAELRDAQGNENATSTKQGGNQDGL